jgi:uracil-DNA glycosylase
VRVYPLYHPAAALRSTGTLGQLREDFARLPALLDEPPPVPIGAVAPMAAVAAAVPEPPQMGLFG